MIYSIFGFHTDRVTSLQRQIQKATWTLQESSVLFAVPLLLILWFVVLPRCFAFKWHDSDARLGDLAR